MCNDILKRFKESMNLKNDSKLGIYVNGDSEFICEFKNLNNLSANYLLLLLLDELINKKITSKKLLLDMINEIL